MEPLTYSEIEKFVRTKLDELSGDAGFITSDSLDISKIIENSAIPVIKRIHLIAPNILLDGEDGLKKITGFTINDNVVRFFLPDNFIRLVSVKMDRWDRAVQTVITEDSVEYRKQKNKYLRGTPSNPVAALLHESGNSMIMELYTAADGSNLNQFLYVPKIGLRENGYPICPKLREACLYAITAEVLRSFDQTNKAQMFDALAMQMLNLAHEHDRLYTPVGEKVLE